MPGIDGLELLSRLKARDSSLPVVLITGHGDITMAVNAMRDGAYDFMEKPFSPERLVDVTRRALEQRGLAREVWALRKQLAERDSLEGRIIGRSPAMQNLRALITNVADTSANVLIEGETGTGKELVARCLHDFSRRKDSQFVALNCGGLAESLFESEIFGHEANAFTGAGKRRIGKIEHAHNGTLFLDEIGELPLEAQARLLRVLQEGEIRRVGSVQSQKVDVRLIAATHRDLKTLAKNGEFREDLFYRLHVIALKLPALRERGSDILEIARAFLVRQSAKVGRDDLKFSPDAEQAIRHYSWPGNVRELENAVERSVILCENPEITADLLGIDIELDGLDDDEYMGMAPLPGSSGSTGNEPAEDLSLEDYFQHFVLEHQDHMTETELARKLGVSRKCLWERRQRLGIPRRKGVANET
ncbi:Two-component sensor CbrB: intrcellular carbon:nitrogen balance [Pseudomonas savastanoi pv. fraxini]|nr:Two-component sensor CbrB: intrcellular carbon:nitrogen balance [Pseudomonas savastanoi pv. fraxini]